MEAVIRMDEDEWIDPVNEIAGKVADRLARRFPMLERDDILHQLWVWILEREEKVKGLYEDQSEALEFYLLTAGKRWCFTEKAAVGGYSVQDLYFYSTKQLREILPLVFDHEDWVLRSGSIDTDRAGFSDPATGGTLLATLADVSRGLGLIRESEYNVLVWRYKYDWTPERLAEELEVSLPAAKSRISYAVRSLQKKLGGKSPWRDDGSYAEFTGERQAWSNDRARYETRRQMGFEEYGDPRGKFE